jgi:branched-chain amino acid transport system substrate-binding protein
MSTSTRFERFRFVLSSLAVSGCSVVARPDFEECKAHGDCRSAFGIGSTCGDDGLCAAPVVNKRCATTFPEDLFTRPENYKNAVVFGSLMDHSSSTHQRRERSSRLAAKQINEERGMDGRTMAIVFCTYEENIQLDNLKPTDAAVASARYLVNVLGVPAMIGPAGSGDASAVYQALRGTGALVMSPSATSPALTDLDPQATDAKPGLLWRTAPPDTLQGPIIAADMAARGVTDVMIIAQRGAYGEGLATVFQQAFSRPVPVRLFGTENERNALVTEGGSASASEVLFISSTQADVIAFLQAAGQNSGYQTKTFFLTDSAANKEVIDGSPPGVLDRIRGTRPTPVDSGEPVFNNFRGSYASEYNEDVTAFSFTAHTYDATWLVFYGSAWSNINEKNISGLGIAKGLRKISSGREFNIQPLTWGSIVEQFRSGSGVNVRGASGTLDYDPATEETSAPIQVWVIRPATAGGHEVQPATQ